MNTMFTTLLAAATTKVEVPVWQSTGVWIKQTGNITVSSAMKMTGVTVGSPGLTMYAYSRGIASQCVMHNGGSARISGGTAVGCSMTGSGYTGRIIVFGGYAIGAEVFRQGRLTVNQAGAVGVSNRVHDRGLLDVSSGGVDSGTTVFSGGTLTVSAGGTALAVTSSAGAVIVVSDGGYIEYA